MWTPSSFALRPPAPHRAGALFGRPCPRPRLRLCLPAPDAAGHRAIGRQPRRWTRPARSRPFPYPEPRHGERARLRRAEVGNRDRAIRAQREARVVGDLPDVAVWIPEAAGVTAVEGLPRRLRYLGPGGCRFGQHPINLGPRPDVVRQGDAAEAIAIAVIDTRVAGQLVACPEDHRHASGLEE